MATTKFNDVDDFLAELKLDAAAGEVDRLIVRVTNRWRTVPGSPLHALAVVASYTVADQVVSLESNCGSFFPPMQEDEKAKATADKRRAAIELVAEKCGLQVRAGVFE